MFRLFIFLFFLAPLICHAYDNPQDCSCAQTPLECGVNAQCSTTCNYKAGSTAWTNCVNSNPDFCPTLSSDTAACWLAFGVRPSCTCVAGITSCHVKTSKELQAGGTCKISGSGIAIAVVVPLVVIAGIGGVIYYCRRHKHAQYETINSSG